MSLGDPAPSPLPRFCPVLCSPVLGRGGRRAAKRGAEWWKEDADPSSYRIVEEIRLVQIPQVQEAGSGEQPVGREGLQDGVHRGRLRRPPSPGLPSLQGGGEPGPELLPERWLAGGGRSGASPGEGRAEAARPWVGGAGGAGALGQRRGAGWAQGPREHREHLADSSSSGSSRGAAGFHGEPGSGAEGLRSPPDRVGAGGGGAKRSPETGWLPGALLSLRLPLHGFCHFPLCETWNPWLVSPAGRSATPPHQYSR